jgi:succinate dehydrogenase/fumarate reductase flavoprotein subunit
VKIIATDVLVIGGGMAGCFAALKAREQGAEVVLVDKGVVGRAGQTPFAMDFATCNPEWGDDSKAWVDELVRTGEYINDQEWTEIVVKESLDRYHDLLSYGCETIKRSDGSHAFLAMPGVATKCIKFPEGQPCLKMRARANQLGIDIIDRFMVTELIKQGGRVIGAAGFDVLSGEVTVFQSKGVCLCAGMYSFKPLGFPGHELSGDSDVMAYRVGAEISGKEFTPIHMTRADEPGGWYPFLDGLSQIAIDHPEGFVGYEDGNGEELVLSIPPSFREYDIALHEGRAPIFLKLDDVAVELMRNKGVEVKNNKIELVLGPNLGMAIHGSEGLFIEPDAFGQHSSLPGLYAGGDAASARHQGSIYCNWGFAILGASVTGARAGRAAAIHAKSLPTAAMGAEELQAIEARIGAPRQRRAGFGPSWVMELLAQTLVPYFVLGVKEAKRLQAALTMVEFYRDHLVPQLTANSAHELRLAHEAHNLVVNAEMKLRASLFREESRGRHFREDFPTRDDESWLAWVIIKQGPQGEMTLSKRPVPDQWKPDASRSYEDKYPFIFKTRRASAEAV